MASDKEKKTRVPVRDSVVIGRTADCDFVINDVAASRHHVRIEARNGEFHWKDLGSTNGTMVNGRPLTEGKLEHGDRIQIGTTEIRFEIESVTEDKPGMFGASTKPLPEGPEAMPVPSADRLLDAVYQVMNEIATNYEPCSLVDSILQTTMRAIDAQRGAVLFAGESAEDLKPCPVCGFVHTIREGVLSHTNVGDIKISGTVARRVLRGGESVLYQDTAQDAEFDAAESIVALRLRSIICVPLRGNMGILGILYIDSDRPKQYYTHEHMLLSTAVGHSAGLALENAQMHQQLLEKQRIEQDIEYAGIIQEGFLQKKWPEADPRFEVYGDTRPAKTVGGDFYDFVQPDVNTIGVLIGDVSGKGVPAALAMAQMLAEFRVRAMQEPSPAEVLRWLNVTMTERSRRGMFCTACYLTVDLRTGTVTCANAGHHAVLRVNRLGVQEFGQALELPLGILRETRYENEQTQLDPDDTLLLYTDGIIEARGAATHNGLEDANETDEYGLDALKILAKGLYGMSPKLLVEEVLKDVLRFCEPASPHDDCTLLGLRYLG